MRTKNLKPAIPKMQNELNRKAIHEAYNENLSATRDAIAQIQKTLVEHHKTLERALHDGRVNWGLVGDVGHVRELLSAIQDFLGNSRAGARPAGKDR